MSELIASLVNVAHNNFLLRQRVWKFVQTKDFANAMKVASKEVQAELKAIIIRGDNDALRRRVKQILNHDLESKSISELRVLGRANRIKYWNNLCKSSLLAELKGVMNVDKPNDDPDQHPGLLEGDETPSSEIRDSGDEVRLDNGTS